MRTLLATTIGLLLSCLLVGLYFASPDTGLNIPVNTSAGVAATIALGLDEPIGLLNTQQSESTTTYTDGTYQIQIIQSGNKIRTILRVIAKKVSGEAFRMNSFSITVRVPRAAIQGIWNPGADPSSTNVMVTDASHPVDDVSDANYGIPYIAAASTNLKNVFAMGLSRQDLSVSISGQPRDNDYEFRLKALTARTSTTFDERFYISTDTGMSWFDIASNYSDWVDSINKYEPFPVSTRAYEPLYDTWYWSEDRVDDRLYTDTAKLASEVGIGLYLADSGWDTDTGEYQKWLNGKTGDYDPPPQKFRNLSETFDNIRSEDKLGIDLWLQPFAVGRQSTRYPKTKGMHIQIPDKHYPAMGWAGLTYSPFALPMGATNLETVNLCPRMASTQTYLKNLFTEVATKYKPEGYWLDFIDGMATYCTASHTHNYALFGDGFRRSLETIKSTILENNPNAVVHFRARYANLNTKPFANVWQSGDSPADFDRMRLNSIRLRPFSKGIVFAADQMYWPEDTSEVRVSKFIMTSVMVGVPAFGPTLIYSPTTTLTMLKAWLSFYRQHQMEIAKGKFTPFGNLEMPNHKIESGTNTFAYIRNLNFSEVTAGSKNVYLMNASDGNRFRGRVRVPALSANYSVTILNRFLNPEPNPLSATSDDKGILNLNLVVQQGGMVILTPKTEAPTVVAAGAFQATIQTSHSPDSGNCCAKPPSKEFNDLRSPVLRNIPKIE